MAYDHRKIGPSFADRANTIVPSLKAQTPARPENFDDKHIPSVSSQHTIKGRIMNSADYD